MDIIKRWLKNLFGNKTYPIDMLSEFTIEDGMNFEQYWTYELNSSLSYSSIFNLDEKVSFEIIEHYILANGNIFNVIYVYNSDNKIAFKMNITLSKCGSFISSNGFYSQIVPKVELFGNEPVKFKAAIKSPKLISDVISPNIELISFVKGSNFTVDGFYNVEFIFDASFLSKSVVFFIKYLDGSVEKRRVFFDTPRLTDIPYYISNNTLIINNDKLPVNLAVFGSKDLNFVYPRDVSIDLSNVDKCVITDVLDNDWIYLK